MQRRGSKWLIALISGALLGGWTTGCAGVRSTMMGWSNDDLVGAAAPEIAEGERIRPFLDASPPEGEADWTLLAFFRPG